LPRQFSGHNKPQKKEKNAPNRGGMVQSKTLDESTIQIPEQPGDNRMGAKKVSANTTVTKMKRIKMLETGGSGGLRLDAMKDEMIKCRNWKDSGYHG